MSSIVIECSRTGLEVSVGIETDEESFAGLPAQKSKMNCPACGAVHVWSKKWAWLRDVPPRIFERRRTAQRSATG